MMRGVLAALGILMTLCACTKTVYLEQETPAGTVPPAPTAAPVSLEEGLQGAYQAEAAERPESEGAAVSGDFSEAYERADRPRIAVFLNRALSAEIREWKSNERIAMTGEVKVRGTYERTDGGGNRVTHVGTENGSGGYAAGEGRLAAESGVGISRQTLVEEVGRRPVGEIWSWEFEDGFMQPLLASGTRLVDRTTIMRLTAVDTARQGNSYDQLAVKEVEMDALRGYADLFVEILVSDSRSGGYEFKVTAKEVESGLILANATTLYPEEERSSVEYKESSRGFVAGKEGPFTTGSGLAYELMTALTQRWNR